MSGPWPDWHIEELKSLLVDPKSGSYADIANLLSVIVGKRYERNACIGKARRLKIAKPPTPTGGPRRTVAERSKHRAVRKRLKRWAAQPSLQDRYKRTQEKRALRQRFAAGGMAKTSPCYRKHLPRLPEMTKNELRAMLARAVMNTAAMELGQ
jgi:hypothetical protein